MIAPKEKHIANAVGAGLAPPVKLNIKEVKL